MTRSEAGLRGLFASLDAAQDRQRPAFAQLLQGARRPLRPTAFAWGTALSMAAGLVAFVLLPPSVPPTPRPMPMPTPVAQSLQWQAPSESWFTALPTAPAQRFTDAWANPTERAEPTGQTGSTP